MFLDCVLRSVFGCVGVVSCCLICVLGCLCVFCLLVVSGVVWLLVLPVVGLFVVVVARSGYFAGGLHADCVLVVVSGV